MPLELLPSLLLSLLAVGYTPGPANIYSLSCVLTHGRAKAMRSWVGLLCGALLRPFVARHNKAVCVVMALALVACSVMIII